MKKQVKLLIAVAGVAVVLIAALLVTLSVLPKEQETRTDETISVTKYPAATIKSVNIENTAAGPAYSISVSYENGQTIITVDDRAGETFDSYYLNNIVDTAQNLKALQVAVDKAPNLADFGITDKSVKVTINKGMGDEKVLQIGALTALKDGYYVKTADDDRIYVVDTSDAEALSRTIYRLRTIELYPDFGSGYNDLQSVLLKKPDGTVVHAEKMTAEEMAKVPNLLVSYKLLEPFAEYIDDQLGGAKFLGPAIGIYVNGIIAEKTSNLAQYGLDKPYTLKTVNTTGETTTILIGSSPDGTQRYIKRSDNDAIMLAAGDFSFLELDPLDILSTLIWVRNITDVTDIKLVTPDRTYAIEINDVRNYDTPKDSIFEASIDGKKVSEENMRRLFVMMVLFPTGGKLAEPVSGEPEYSFTFTYRDGTDHVLNLYRLNDMQLAAEVDGLARFYTSVSQMNAILDGLNTIEEGGVIPET